MKNFTDKKQQIIDNFKKSY